MRSLLLIIGAAALLAACEKENPYYTYEFSGTESIHVAQQIGQLRQGMPPYYENVIAEATNVANGWAPPPAIRSDHPDDPPDFYKNAIGNTMADFVEAVRVYELDMYANARERILERIEERRHRYERDRELHEKVWIDGATLSRAIFSKTGSLITLMHGQLHNNTDYFLKNINIAYEIDGVELSDRESRGILFNIPRPVPPDSVVDLEEPHAGWLKQVLEERGAIPLKVRVSGAELVKGEERIYIGQARRVTFEQTIADFSLPLSSIDRRVNQLKTGHLLPRRPDQFPDEYLEWLPAEPMFGILREHFPSEAVDSMQSDEGYTVANGEAPWNIRLYVYECSRVSKELVEKGCEGNVITAVEMSGELPVPAPAIKLLDLLDRAVYVKERPERPGMGPSQLAQYHVLRGQQLGGMFEYDLGGMMFKVAGVERRSSHLNLASPFTFEARRFTAVNRKFLGLEKSAWWDFGK